MRQSVLFALVAATVVAMTQARSVPVPISARLPAVCRLPKVVGRCRAAKPRFYFNGKKCVEFKYGGCGGNANNFATVGACMKKCMNGKGPMPRPRPISAVTGTQTFYWRMVNGKAPRPMPISSGRMPWRMPRPNPRPNVGRLGMNTLRQKTVPYIVTVYTGTVGYAGTDAKVFIKVRGRKIFLKNSKTNRGLKSFDKGKKDVFEVYLIPMKMDKLTIGHDNSGSGPGWWLDRVTLTRKSTPGKSTVFKCKRWLARDDGDKKIVRTLKASK